MRSLILIILIVSTIGCSKDIQADYSTNNNFQLVTDIETANPSIVDTGSSSSFNSISERYSSINETTSYYKGQEYFVNYLAKYLAKHLAQ